MQSKVDCMQAAIENASLHDKCVSMYPSVCRDGYEPFLPYKLHSPRTERLLEAVSATLHVGRDKEVCFFCPGTQQHEVRPLEYIHDLDPCDDFCIMPVDGSWLLYHSRQKTWHWGRQHRHSHLFHNNNRRFFVHWGTSNLRTLIDILVPAAKKMQVVFDVSDLRAHEAAFRESKSDSFVYILRGEDVWFEVTMQRYAEYFHWQMVTHNRSLIDEWRQWFNIFL